MNARQNIGLNMKHEELKVANKDNLNEAYCPIPLSVIPNQMGINLCSVESVALVKQEDDQLVSLTIKFNPEPREAGSDAPLESVEARYKDLLFRLGVLGHDAEAKLSECVTSYEKEVAGLTAELNAKDEEILEQCQLNGMGAEREAALLGKVAQQSAALKLARDAIDAHLNPCGCSNGCEFCSGKGYLSDALAAINEVLKGE